MKTYAFDLDLTLVPLFLALFEADEGDLGEVLLFAGPVSDGAVFFVFPVVMLSSQA